MCVCVGGGVVRGGFISFRLARRGELVTGWAGDKRDERGVTKTMSYPMKHYGFKYV